jgi:N-acetylglutamate synthase-like GNAT family acetyltransferase
VAKGRPGAATRIRAARPNEAGLLSDLCCRAKAAWGYDAAFMALVRDSLRVSPEAIAAGDVWVAEHDGVPAGVMALGAADEADTVQLTLLFIEPSRMRRGVGRALLGHATMEAARRGARKLVILSDPNAGSFYERMGAALIGQGPSDAIPGRLLPLYAISLSQR